MKKTTSTVIFDKRKIEELRVQNGLKHEEFAAIAGVSRNLVDAWKEGRSTPNAHHLAALHGAFGIVERYFFVEIPTNVHTKT